MTEWTTIRISQELHNTLKSIGRKDETFDQVIIRILEDKNQIVKSECNEYPSLLPDIKE